MVHIEGFIVTFKEHTDNGTHLRIDSDIQAIIETVRKR